jgi:hypothetical protein
MHEHDRLTGSSSAARTQHGRPNAIDDKRSFLHALLDVDVTQSSDEALAVAEFVDRLCGCFEGVNGNEKSLLALGG